MNVPNGIFHNINKKSTAARLFGQLLPCAKNIYGG